MIKVFREDANSDTGYAEIQFPDLDTCSIESGGALVVYNEFGPYGEKGLFVVAGFAPGCWSEFLVNPPDD